MAPDGQNYRAVNAIRLLNDKKKLSLDDLISKGYNHYLAAFDVMLPPLFKAYESAPDSVKQNCEGPVNAMKQCDRNSAPNAGAAAGAGGGGARGGRRRPPAGTE